MNKAISEIMAYLGPSAKYEIDKGLIIQKTCHTDKHLHKTSFTSALSVLGKIKDSNQYTSEDLLFFDIETSGTSGSSGIIVFMFGCGYFEDGVFFVEQVFMPNPSRTLEMMKYLRDLFRKKRLLLSFNGKAFDLNIIKDKMAMMRLEEMPDFDHRQHFDLLFTGRRLFKKIISSCSLSSIEKNILEIQRTEDDIPGFLIPLAYSQFLHEHLTGDIKKIFYHNKMDIISLLDLINHFASIMEAPTSQKHVKDDLELAKLLRKQKPEESEKIYRFITSEKYPDDIKNLAWIRLSLLLKSTERREEAVKIWEELVRTGKGGTLPYFELAKYHEHVSKDLKSAEATTLKLLEMSEQKEQLGMDQTYKHDPVETQKRLERIRKKMNRRFY